MAHSTGSLDLMCRCRSQLLLAMGFRDKLERAGGLRGPLRLLCTWVSLLLVVLK